VTIQANIDARPRSWLPRRLLATRSARGFEHGRAILARADALSVDIVELVGDRLTLDIPADPRRAYVEAKATLALVVAPPSKRRLQPIAPSADWRVDLAEGCPAHCSYCYLAGSLKGPPVTRVYANLDEILDVLPAYLGQGMITSRSTARSHEGTTFEASCYTDPLALEPLTGSLSAAFAWFGRWNAEELVSADGGPVADGFAVTDAAREGCVTEMQADELQGLSMPPVMRG
jgi:spore photoproduct lyase